MNRVHLSILTLNLWNTEFWERREETIRSFLQLFDPDICCFQEVRPSTLALLDQWLFSHERIRDIFPGWENEGNIYFRKNLFTLKEYGALDPDMPETERRLFWVRLAVANTEKTVFISTVHLTHQGNADELRTGFSHRHREAHIIRENLPRLRGPEEAAIVAGDFNDPVHPSRIIAEAGFSEAFNSLGLISPVTFPSQPATDEIQMTEAIDRIMSAGPLRPVLASVPRYYSHGSSCSDHWPVIAVYELLA